jgi:sterol desaturase/sphingolipid hydroxylase (fatty acid hydroxylase superfamily)
MHRFLHTRWMFKKIHCIHHSSRNPTALTFLTLHPVETIMTSLSTPLCIFLFPISANALIILYMLNLIHAAYAHNGFEWFPGKFSRQWGNNAIAHYLHHKNVKVNFSYYYLFWDRLFGTLDKNYDKTYEAVIKKMKPKKQPIAEASICIHPSN